MNTLRKIEQREIDSMLDSHSRWRKGDSDGKQLVLYDADLSDLILTFCDFGNSIIRCCDFSKSDISDSFFNGSFIDFTLFDNAVSINTRFCGSKFYSSSFMDSNLKASRFDGACFSRCVFDRSDLSGASFRGTRIIDSTLRTAKSIPFIPMACPEEGSFIGWKKACGCIIKLLIPEDALRSSSITRKCRCSKAKVLEIQKIDGTKSILSSIGSDRDENFVYTVGETVSVDNFDTDRFHECAPGIHFFINRQEAVNYMN